MNVQPGTLLRHLEAPNAWLQHLLLVIRRRLRMTRSIAQQFAALSLIALLAQEHLYFLNVVDLPFAVGLELGDQLDRLLHAHSLRTVRCEGLLNGQGRNVPVGLRLVRKHLQNDWHKP